MKPLKLKSTKSLSLRIGYFVLFALFATVLFAQAARAAPAAGASIGNQASATYVDDTSVTRTVTSNTVVTIVQQVASFTLTADGDRRANAGGQVAFPHTLTNTGNGADTFALTQTEAGAFTFSSVAIYADANGDGVPDNTTNFTSTGELAAGAAFRFVVVTTVPGSAVTTQSAAVTVRGRSGFNNTITHTNLDTVTVTTQAVVSVTKAIDLAYGPSSGTRNFTLTYTNSGNTAASALTITDVIPSGMTYIAGSARWSVTGSTVLTDANAEDQTGIVYDFGITPGRITAVIATVGAGQSGTITFQASINAGQVPGANAATANTARYAYNNGSINIAAENTNTAQYTIAQAASVTVSSVTIPSATQGATFNFTNTVTNTGNGTDTFNLALLASTFPAGTTLQLFRADGLTPLTDSNGDGIPDTGPLANGANVSVVVKATLPQNVAAAPGNGPYAVNLRGTSVANPASTGQGTDTLTTITANTVDLTNDAAGSGNPGFGPGPGALAVSNTVAPNGTTRFNIVIANNSAIPDSFDLAASRFSNFSDLTFPAGWTVVFHDASGNVLTNSGVIAAGTTRTVYADVTAPANATAGFDLYFRGLSPSSGVSDILYDAVAVGTVRSIVLTPNNLGQATSGGTTVYTHMISNTGTNLEGAGGGGGSTVSLTTADDAGFTSVVHWDQNNNGVLDPADPIVTSLADLTGGTNGASTAAGLSPGETARLFVKVNAPPGAAPGVTNTTTLTAGVTGVIGGAAAPTGIFVTDTTAVVGSNLSLVKTQALDANCDGTEEGSFSTDPLGTNAVPGACIRYRITATNAGGTNIGSLLLNDSMPVNTTYHGTAAAAAVTVGTVTTVPANGAAGAIQATVGTLTPGQIAVLSFGVRIDP